MKIDVLSQNTLKLTLSKLDMFDLDIKYESLSGKNPETKRLLSHVIKSIECDEQVSFDFSGERLFIEAFPRIDGGCMLYISCMENTTAESGKKSRRSLQGTKTDFAVNNLSMYRKAFDKPKNTSPLICDIESAKLLGGLCRCLDKLPPENKPLFTSSLYERDGMYRLIIFDCSSAYYIRGVLNEFGKVQTETNALAETEEYFRLLSADNAVETISKCF